MGGRENARATQLFIMKDEMPMPWREKPQYVAIGKVVKGMSVVDQLHAFEPMVNNGRIKTEGNTYLTDIDPELTLIETARVLPG
jgi:cyclophilin family peptidyl-prolyl cis-trans isomerase